MHTCLPCLFLHRQDFYQMKVEDMRRAKLLASGKFKERMGNTDDPREESGATRKLRVAANIVTKHAHNMMMRAKLLGSQGGRGEGTQGPGTAGRGGRGVGSYNLKEMGVQGFCGRQSFLEFFGWLS